MGPFTFHSLLIGSVIRSLGGVGFCFCVMCHMCHVCMWFCAGRGWYLCQIWCESVHKWWSYGRLTDFKMTAAATLNCYLVTVDHPRSLLHGPKFALEFHVNRFTTFREMDIWKFCKFGLKHLLVPPNLHFWGFWPPDIIFFIEKPKTCILGRIRIV